MIRFTSNLLPILQWYDQLGFKYHDKWNKGLLCWGTTNSLQSVFSLSPWLHGHLQNISSRLCNFFIAWQHHTICSCHLLKYNMKWYDKWNNIITMISFWILLVLLISSWKVKLERLCNFYIAWQHHTICSYHLLKYNMKWYDKWNNIITTVFFWILLVLLGLIVDK